MEIGRRVLVEIEVPRGGRLKFRPDGRLQYASPLPCPFNYGCAPAEPLATDGDPQDVVVLGPRRAAGDRLEGVVVGQVEVIDDGKRDDKWVVSPGGAPATAEERARVERFFARYELGKRVLAALRGTGPATVRAVRWDG